MKFIDVTEMVRGYLVDAQLRGYGRARGKGRRYYCWGCKDFHFKGTYAVQPRIAWRLNHVHKNWWVSTTLKVCLPLHLLAFPKRGIDG